MGIWMVTHKFTWLLQECRNVFYYEEDVGAPSTSEWQDIVDEIEDDYTNNLLVHMSDQWQFWGIDYRKVDVAGLLSFEALPTAGPAVGSVATDSLPTQIALLVSVKGTTTKPNRARTYMCGWTEASATDSLWVGGALDVAEVINDLQSVLNGPGTNPLQRVAAQWNTNHSMVTVTNNIAAASSKSSTVPATQRRRRIGVGI